MVLQKFSQTHSIKLCTVFDFLHLTFFSFTFYNKFDENCLCFLWEKLRKWKGKIFSKIIFENCAFYGLNTEPEPYLSKVGTETVTLQKSEPVPQKIVTVQQHWISVCRYYLIRMTTLLFILR